MLKITNILTLQWEEKKNTLGLCYELFQPNYFKLYMYSMSQNKVPFV